MKSDNRNRWVREELLHLLSLSGTLAGLCITGVALFYTLVKSCRTATIVDDLFVICALIFLLCTYCIFIALRTKHSRVSEMFNIIADTLFIIGLTGMVITSFVMVYTIW